MFRLNDPQNFENFRRKKDSISNSANRVSRLIDYTVFKKQYWGKYRYDPKSFEPDLVFSEILGIIKGSTSVERQFKPLSREEYLHMGDRRAPVFTNDGAKDTVYSIYEEYERKKRIGDGDDIDRVIKLLTSLGQENELKNQLQHLFDEVYVDGKYA